MRSFEFVRVMENGEPVSDEPKYSNAKLPMYKTKHAAGADFFCVEDVEIPSIWSGVAEVIAGKIKGVLHNVAAAIKNEEFSEVDVKLKPTLIHTGIKANMLDDEVLILSNRSSGPNRGLVLANGVGVIDKDYYNNPSNDGEIMFMYWNFKPWKVKLSAGDSIGQGIFQKFLRPEIGLSVMDIDGGKRQGGFGSTGR